MSSPKFDTFEKKSLTCAYCKKIGHLMADCFRLQKKNERDNKPKTSACTTPYITSTLECPASQAFKSSFCDYMEEYKPFMSDGFISIVDDTTLQPIKILRDTGASQSLLLEGNDLARNKVVAEPIVTSEPVVDVKSPEDDAELYPACVVTRAMARKQQDENLQEDQFDYMDLSDTFLADIEGPGSSEKAIIRPPSVNKNVIMPWPDVNSHSLDRKNLFEEQHKDPEGKNLETDFGSALPLIIFGSVGLIAGITSLILPETTAKSLPETVEDADTLDNNDDPRNAADSATEMHPNYSTRL
ncbi:Hypothetical predicted protein [Mytilus galloprovincialis]|uniref:Peptidase A2 domain-containing protein n=1 Tax=Mytilus galloprovincialis TaxID=29158 RepID=A0A8B6EZK3_MYTGA|nr:Hypothetical predicted protein [Mytilus galloprovincialis]